MGGLDLNAAAALPVLLAERVPAWMAMELVAAVRQGIGEARRKEASGGEEVAG